MPSLSETIARLSAARGMGRAAASPTRLSELTLSGSNPGALKAYTYLPDLLAPNAPLVVVLHGCTQSAADYDHGSGWSQLADRRGFALLFPEQQRANNPHLCFNWFAPDDIHRNGGEVLSIVQMIRSLIDAHGLDERRVFITGLSAGGAMAAVMLATHPDIFAGGAVIAGLPFGCAASVPEAMARMRGQGLPAEAALVDAVRAASPHTGPWPSLSIWHGMQDHTVAPAAGEAVLSQWRGVHGLEVAATETRMLGAHRHRVWRDGAGVARVEAFAIAGMGHGAPIQAGDGIGAAGPYMLNAGISSTRHIAAFWQIAEAVAATDTDQESADAETGFAARPSSRDGFPHRLTPARQASGPGKVIEDALRAAGLMR
jgi:poly(hydroxyalkanoate) depolymerase family esterase